MNFLEQLAAEWYEYRGYFVQTNHRFGQNAQGHGGHEGEIDVIACKFETREFIHIETSTDALSWEKRRAVFERKFSGARRHYMEIFPFKELDILPRQIAVVGLNRNPVDIPEWHSTPPVGSPWGQIRIEVVRIPSFVNEICAELQGKDPRNEAIPEKFPLLRAMQYSLAYQSV